MVGDVDILVDAALADLATELEQERLRRDVAVLGDDDAVGQKDLRGVVGDRARIEQLPAFAIGVDRPGAEHSRVVHEQAALARPLDLPVQLGHEHASGLADRPTFILSDM